MLGKLQFTYMENKDALVQAFIRKSILHAPDRFKSYIYNEAGKPYHRRFAYDRYDKYANDFREGSSANRFIIAPGLRGTGKTTIVGQLYNDLLRKGVDEERMLYVSMDEAMGTLGCTITDIVRGYEQFLSMNIEMLVERNERIYLFIDEAHHDPDWSLRLKVVYDRSRNVFIFVTGSSAIALTFNADVARRATVVDLLPMSYPEYNLLKDYVQPPSGMSERLASALYASSSAREAYDRLAEAKPPVNEYLIKVGLMQLNEYLKLGSLPFAIPMKEEREVYDSVSSMIEKVIYKDLGTIGKFDRGTQLKIMNLLTLLAINDRTNLNKLTSDLGLSRPTLIECIDALEKAGLILRVWPHGSSSAHIRKTPKYKFAAPVIRATMLWRVGELSTHEMYGALLEDVVAMYLHRAVASDQIRGFEFDPDDNSADFIVTARDGSQIVIEAGYGHKDTEQVRNSMAHCNAKYCIVISNDLLELRDEKILVVSRELFLLS